MNKTVKWLLFSCLIFVLTGCYETKKTFYINPDGSGKVNIESVFMPFNINLSGGEVDPQQQLADARQGILEKSTGIEAWKDVVCKRTYDGKISFRGTAYFQNISKLKFENISNANMKFSKLPDGNISLEIIQEEKDKPGQKPKPMSEEEIKKKMQSEKAKYQQMKPILAGLFSGLREEMIFRLPGPVEKYTNLVKDKNGNLTFVLSGKKLLAVMDELSNDDAWQRKVVTTGNDDPFQQEGFLMNEKMFGQKKPIQVIVESPFKPLFNYKTEVSLAKKESKVIFEKAHAAEPVPLEASAMGNFTSVKVAAVRIVNISDEKQDIRPFYQKKGYTLCIEATMPGSILSVPGGKLIKAFADNGQSLLPDSEWDRKINFPKLSKDKTRVLFEVWMKLPEKDIKGIREVSGSVDYLVAGSVKEIDLGISEFTAGKEGKQLNSKIKSVQKNRLELKLNLSFSSIKQASFYDAEGSKIEVSQNGYFSSGSVTTITYEAKQNFPEKGHIKVEYYDNLKKFTVPFEIKDITLAGRHR